MAKPTTEQLAKINRFAKTPLTADNVHVHRFRMIGTGYIPSRFLQFDRSLMEIYLANIEKGDVVQIADHSFGGYSDNVTLPFGRFFEGHLTQDGDKTQLDGSMFMPASSKTYIGDFTTDDISQQIDAGILHDSSVSVTWGFSECSICHNDIRDYEQCRHWPGRYYDIEGGAQRVLCTVIAKPKPQGDNSMMIENSIVCAGAYPDAGVLSVNANLEHAKEHLDKHKAFFNNIADLKLVNKDAPVFCCLSSTSATFQIESENLRDVGELHQMHHDMYKLEELPEGWTKARLSAEHKKVVQALFDEGHEHFLVDALDGALNESLKTKSKKGSENTVDEQMKLALEKQITDLTTEVQGFTVKIESLEKENGEFKAKVDELTPLAALGTKYREDVIEDAIKAGIRDQQNDFDEATYREMFSALDIDKVKSFAEKWEASALAKLGVPAGHTQGEKLELPGSELKQAVDPNLYKVGR